jgi:Kef-type K+ transport system membrane component KefB
MGAVDASRVLLDLAVILVASRLAAEGAERFRQPAVLGEIILGVLIGPSVLGLVRGSQALDLLGEIGVILLLFEVGREMDLVELRRVGGASLRVAFIGVAVPMALGYLVLRGLSIHGHAALFLAAGITATSVGITARVFGDLRALATAEARIVLGAAVADDIIGLLVLTVVVKLATGGHLAAGSVAATFGLAIGFVVAATVLGALIAPGILARTARRARTDGTVMALGLVLALVFARVASGVGLAPVVGAFVAGLAVGRSEVADDLHRKLVPLGHFFIPVFFLKIGIDTQIGAIARGNVLIYAAALCVVAVVGKIVAGAGVPRGTADRFLVGVGMIPRGEVGLIFASLGLARGVLDARLYGLLVMVVLATTLITPPWLRRRVEKARRRAFERHVAAVEPEGGWLAITGSEVELAADPPPDLAGRIAFEAAAACGTRRPGPRLNAFVSAGAAAPIKWDDDLRKSFFDLLSYGGDRSWRFLELTGMLDALLPDLGAAMRRLPRDPFELNPENPHRFETLEALLSLSVDDRAAAVMAEHPRRDLVLLAALARSVTTGGPEAGALARKLAQTTRLSPEDFETAEFIAANRHLLTAAAARGDMSNEEQLLDLASFVGERSPQEGLYVRAEGLYVLAVAENAMEPWERERLDELFGLLIQALAHPELTGPSARDLAEHRHSDVAAILSDLPPDEVRGHLRAAPRRYLLTQDPATIARHIRMVRKKLRRHEARLEAEPGGSPGEWRVHVATLDRRGLLALLAGAFVAEEISVIDAQISTWQDRNALDVFRVEAADATDWERVCRRIEAELESGPPAGEPPAIDGVVKIDNLASPWYSIVELRAHDRAGLLHKVARAMYATGLQIHQATLTTHAAVAVDTFWVTGRNGGKLDDLDEKALRQAFAGKAPRRALLRGFTLR